MADAIYRIKLFRCLTQPRHTAFRVKRGRTAHFQQSGHKIHISREDKPPPAVPSLLYGTLDAFKAADVTPWCDIGFFYQPRFVRCRGPPYQKNP